MAEQARTGVWAPHPPRSPARRLGFRGVPHTGDRRQLHFQPSRFCSCRTLGGFCAPGPGGWAALVLRSCGLHGAIACAFSHVSSTAGISGLWCWEDRCLLGSFANFLRLFIMDL